ncbi:YceI family protein [Phenylobacterium sp.]|uniref:YceI family protein n=1 Tax=Phenylobacterium sp. TaxID=1871053 RepID=UPI00121B37B9|nr:YceI family protein [Phenylobacterium sp.]THD64620.1 MAG: polyisoprenoid-binding protein [Phenylobacterium sp.]
MIRSVAAALVAGLVLSAGPGSAAWAAPSTTDPAKVPAGAYVLDKRHASLTVKIVHMGFSHYTMRFDGLDGSFTYDPANWSATKATITVDAKSVDTHDSAFDKQIAGYFEADKYPTITFVSTSVQGGADGKGTLTGDLTFHGVTKPVTLDVTFDGAGHGVTPLGTRLGFSGSGRIKRSDFGVNNMLQFASDDVDLAFEVEFEKK